MTASVIAEAGTSRICPSFSCNNRNKVAKKSSDFFSLANRWRLPTPSRKIWETMRFRRNRGLLATSFVRRLQITAAIQAMNGMACNTRNHGWRTKGGLA